MLSMVIAAMVAFGSVETEAKKHACKTLKRSQCIKRTDCTWVKSHKRGVKKVKAYCKKKRK